MRVSDQNCVSRLYIIVEIHHSGRKPSNYVMLWFLFLGRGEGAFSGGADMEQFIIIVVIIALKGAIQDFLQSPHCAMNGLQHVHSSGPGAIMCST